MNFFRSWLLTFVLTLSASLSVLRAEKPLCVVTHYGDGDGLNLRHATQILQDSVGFIWISAWNGLFRYDGHEFVSFHSAPGDGFAMNNDHIRNMWSIGNRIFCRVDEGNVVFDTELCKFRNPTFEEVEYIPESPTRYLQSHPIYSNQEVEYTDLFGVQWRITRSGQVFYLDSAEWKVYPYRITSPQLRRWMEDRQGNLWLLGSDDGVWKISFVTRPFSRYDATQGSQVRAITTDSKGRIWISRRTEKKVLVTDSYLNPLGYLAPDGTIQLEEQSFGAAVFCIFHASDTVTWLGCKPEGLYRIIYHSDGKTQINHFDELPNNTVYDIKADAKGRLWVATFGAGVVCVTDPLSDQPSFLSMGNGLGVKINDLLRVRDVEIFKDIVLAATSSGLLVGKIPDSDLSAMNWKLHGRNPNRRTSLSSNVTTDICYDGYNTLYVGTESGGVNLLDVRQDLLSDSLTFSRIGREDGLVTDAALTLHYQDVYLYITGTSSIMIYNSMAKEISSFDSRFFHENIIFSEAHPFFMGDTWLFGLDDGMAKIRPEAFREYQYAPEIIWSSLSGAGAAEPDFAVNRLKELTLKPSQRSFTLRFAALDFVNSDVIDYSFRFVGKDNQWMYLHDNNSITMMDMHPGKYYLEVRSTNSNGVWVPNTRMLLINVPAQFSETRWADFLFVLVMVVLSVLCTVLFMKHKRREHDSEP